MLWIPIDRALDIPLNRQIYQQIREKILSGQLQAGEKLVSTRELSVELKVSRNVILEAYDQLLAEGFLIARRGAGTFVAEGTLLPQQTKPLITNKAGDPIVGKEVVNLRSGIPALDLFPRKTWARISNQLWHDSESSILGYGVPEGRIELRHTLAHYLLRTRGVECHPEQIIITSGATQAMMLVSRLLLSSNDIAIMEDPITNDIQTIFKASGATIYPVPVDDFGMKTSLLPDNIDPKLVFLTPSHQFPLGSTLPIQRRIQLIEYARKNHCFLIEDDYDSEFRYEGPPVSSLQGLDPELVLYIGSFSKILSPALRIGYIILPTQLTEKCRQLKWFTDLHTPSLDQLILSRFIQEGYMERHITKMKKFYKSQRDFLIQCLQSTFSHNIKIFGYSTGMHLVAEFEKIDFTRNLLVKIEQFGVKVYPVEDHTIKKGKYNNRLIIGYGHLQKHEIELGITRLFQAIYH
ncbi:MULTISPECIES: MocR-like pyridoxine biosynthesis transcription factor PdxR [Lysinibacillus]|uniref:MocR-like pyridoxine biosynthesis transcription factor PdxR n=1 Tax=Lysinibacillus TaxID=400634 RepID=UPI0021A964C9|nr:PLP-dependent aminotransferase family protein [Lysinibacillus capsici]MCT1540042.1 PLP-dependent aminotransferase family protein [Lysinibacillus capsici]MCT1571068.1 PLP-dependent aminotransferase family protein [Lysinibacillus capsici]MCT1648515.1 PLP-dependent aminotransferase family protein [Lysinibacillus capsici]MCT1727057.1 PLP-dependent aminotransferase family protein [Lysinibacillus capsici]MCT1784412.1 PLP-dependent aminotransferase family protein [Lysinibacillus capsici]